MTSTRSSKSRRGKAEVNSESDFPEVIHANDLEIKKLRELHESASLPVEKRRRVKKTKNFTEPVSTSSIDPSVLEGAAAASSVSAAGDDKNGARDNELQITANRISLKKV